MSGEDDKGQHECLRKYEAILKQLIDMADAKMRPSKRRKLSKVLAGEPSTDVDEDLVKTITKFMHELDDNRQGNLERQKLANATN